MKDIMNYWEEEWRKITDFTSVTSKEDLIQENENQIHYYNVSGQKIATVKSEKNAYKLVITKVPQIAQKKLSKEFIIDLPTADIIDQMIEVFRLTEQNGHEHGFAVYEDRTPSKIIEGTEIPKEKWYEILRDKDYKFYYTVHSHPKNKAETATTEPSIKDLTSALGSSNIGVILAYGLVPETNTHSGVSLRKEKKLKRSILFHTQTEKIKKDDSDTPFDGRGLSFINIKNVNRL